MECSEVCIHMRPTYEGAEDKQSWCWLQLHAIVFKRTATPNAVTTFHTVLASTGVANTTQQCCTITAGLSNMEAR